jgi:hypothetical protein
MFDPSADDNYAIGLAAERTATSPSSNDCCKTSASIRRPTTTTPCDWLLRTATSRSSNDCCKTSASIRRPTTTTPSDGLLRTATSRSSNDCCKTLRVDPSADDNNYATSRSNGCSIRRPSRAKTATSRSSNDCCKTSASIRRPTTTTPCDGCCSRSSNDCCKTSASIRRPTTTRRAGRAERPPRGRRTTAARQARRSVGRRQLRRAMAAQNGHLAVVDRLLEDDRVDVAVAIQCSRPEHRKRFECRERLTEICIALQDLALPAWITVQILDAARPWSTLPLHSKWNLVCAVKHFHDKHPAQ